MVAEKTLRFQGKNWDLDELSNQIVQQLQADGYKTQLKGAPMGTIVQAQKAGILRDIITADRAFTIMISGQPNDFTIHVGIGKWVQNIAVAVVESLLISAFFLAVAVPEMVWTTHVEKEIIRKISDIASKPPLQQTNPL